MEGLSPKEEIQLRIECLKPVISICSRYGIERGQVFQCAEEYWEFATKTIREGTKRTTSSRKKPVSDTS